MKRPEVNARPRAYVPDWHVRICVFSSYGADKDAKAPFLVMGYDQNTYWANTIDELREIVTREVAETQGWFTEFDKGFK